MSRFRENIFDWIAWLMFALIPVVIFWQSSTSLAEQDAASGGPLENAALYPRAIATLLTIIVVAQGVRLFFSRPQIQTAPASRPQTPMALALTLLFVVYLIVLPYAGFHVVTPVLLFVMTCALGLGPLSSLAGSIVLWLATSFVFEGLLNVVLPVGMFNLSIFH